MPTKNLKQQLRDKILAILLNLQAGYEEEQGTSDIIKEIDNYNREFLTQKPTETAHHITIRIDSIYHLDKNYKTACNEEFISKKKLLEEL